MGANHSLKIGAIGVSYALLVFMLVMIPPKTSYALASIKGDIDSNRTVNTNDAILLSEHILGLDIGIEENLIRNAGDTNCDHTVDVRDALSIAIKAINPLHELWMRNRKSLRKLLKGTKWG